MRLVRPIFLAVLVVGLATYAVDCGATMTPDEAMQCCNSMPCSSRGQDGQDCCKTMPSMHAPYVQTSSVRGPSFSRILFASMPPSVESLDLPHATNIVAAEFHSPPIPGPLGQSPLRV